MANAVSGLVSPVEVKPNRAKLLREQIIAIKMECFFVTVATARGVDDADAIEKDLEPFFPKRQRQRFDHGMVAPVVAQEQVVLLGFFTLHWKLPAKTNRLLVRVEEGLVSDKHTLSPKFGDYDVVYFNTAAV